MPRNTPLIRPPNDQAIALATSLITNARFGSLGVLHPISQTPVVTRLAIGTLQNGAPMSLVSDLAGHTQALKANTACSLLLGEPIAKGDPLTHPRITLQCRAEFLSRTANTHTDIRAHYLKNHPKSKLYIDFADFSFVVFHVTKAAMNGGFGKAYEFTPAELGL